jgi:hypothetical protein
MRCTYVGGESISQWLETGKQLVQTPQVQIDDAVQELAGEDHVGRVGGVVEAKRQRETGVSSVRREAWRREWLEVSEGVVAVVGKEA